MEEGKIQLFDDKRIRTTWDNKKEECYFSVVDVVGVLIGESNGQKNCVRGKCKIIAECRCREDR